MTNKEIKRDRFAEPEYVNPDARLPFIQALRGENGADECGYFITESEMAKANFIVPIPDDRMIVYEYNTGGKERGLLMKAPRMLVVAKTPLFAFDRVQTRSVGRTVVAGRYDKQLFSNREQFGTAQGYEILLLSHKNEPLHEVPFKYLAKGANQASFSFHWQQLVTEVTKCHAVANNIPARAKNALFNSLCVFQFTVKRELAGTNTKSAACKVGSHVAPEQSNWEQFFLGRNDELADRVLNILCPTTELVLPNYGGNEIVEPAYEGEFLAIEAGR